MSTTPSVRYRLLLSGFAFFLVLIVGYGSDFVLTRHPDWIIADDLILGIAAALVVFQYEKERSRFFSEKLRVIRDMNAFVRNELQILYASLERPEQTRVTAIERGVERIDWALRELLPGGHTPEVSSVGSRDLSEDRIERSA
jgi:hypothetical protein